MFAPLRHALRIAALAAAAWLSSGCTTAIVALHVYDRLTEGDPSPCFKLNSVQRALETRCGAYEPGSLKAVDLAQAGLQECPLALAVRDPALWPVVPDLLAIGAQPEACRTPPLAALAQALPCPDFTRATPAQREALRRVAELDARAIQPETLHALSCPAARDAGLDAVIADWQAQGRLAPGQLLFSPLGALHPSALHGPLAQALEAEGHGAHQALAAGGFEEALRQADLHALDWWLQREPGLVNQVPPLRAGQLPWVPLARVVVPGFIGDEARQRQVVDYLLAHGADPWRRLPHDSSQSPASLATRLHSPLAPLLQNAPLPAPSAGPLAAIR